jgi:DNA-binding transcriptional LysR family regulator
LSITYPAGVRCHGRNRDNVWGIAMRLKQLADFLAIVECGSIRAAARLLGVSQPAITRSLRRLETDVGAVLLQRTSHGILLTPTGRAFFGRVRVAHAELQKAQDEAAKGEASEGVVTFGVGPTVGALVVPRAVASFRVQYPRIRLRILEGFAQHLAPLVRDGTLDFAVGTRPQQKDDSALTLKPLFTHELVIAARKGHALRGARSLRELAGAEWASLVPPRSDDSAVRKLFAAARLPAPGDAIQCESYHLLVALVAGTEMLGLLTRKLMAEAPARDCLQVINVRETLPTYTIYQFTRTGIPLGVPATALAKTIASAARRLTTPGKVIAA